MDIAQSSFLPESSREDTRTNGSSSLRYIQKVTLPKKAERPENDIKAGLRIFLNKHFLVTEEVVGKGPEGERVRMDFWCIARPTIIRQGWPASYFGVEVKSHGIQDQRKKTAARLVYQASRYSLSQFPTELGTVYPYFVLIYPSIEMILANGDDDPMFRDGFVFGLTKEAAMFRVGEIKLHGELPTSEDSPIPGFEVVFHGINRWYHSKWGRARIDCLGSRTTRASR